MDAQVRRATVTVEEAARFLGISRGSAYARVHDGGIPSIRVGRRILIPAPRLAEMLAGSGIIVSAARQEPQSEPDGRLEQVAR